MVDYRRKRPTSVVGTLIATDLFHVKQISVLYIEVAGSNPATPRIILYAAKVLVIT